MSTFPGDQPEHIEGQLGLEDIVPMTRLSDDGFPYDPTHGLDDPPEPYDWEPQDDEHTNGDALGPCGCVDYHMADCDGSAAMTKDDYLDLYAGSYPDDWPDDEGMW